MKNSQLKTIKFIRSSSGFTLVELLVGLTIATMVITISGIGLSAIMNANAKAEDETSRRIELNRALDFIADEVRRSQSIATNASTVTPTGFTVASTVNSSSVQKILALTIPGVATPVVYYIATIQSGQIWSGPKVIYRWGPALNINGTYSSAASSNELLVDFIDSSTPSPNSICASPATNPNPPVANRTGFYACVDAQGKIANIYLRGKLSTSSTPYLVNTTATARSN